MSLFVRSDVDDADPKTLDELQSFEREIGKLIRSGSDTRIAAGQLDRQVGSLVNLLIAKGLITPQEYVAKLHEMARGELEAQRRLHI